uniref:Uncharacterized protein n=1 Tax=Rhizophagus irregularis (strain DAOM 181602 / DAOM 197198 / MUCL 43194) TaxID=747089 RepID=U9TIL7_RHIID
MEEFDNINNDEKSTESSSNNSNMDEFDNISDDEKSTESSSNNSNIDEFDNISDDEKSTESSSNSSNYDDNDFEALPLGYMEALHLLEIKSRTNMTDQVYSEIMSAFSEHQISLYCASKKLEKMISISPIWIDCCINSCNAFTGDLKDLQNCPIYLKRSEALQYRHIYTSSSEYINEEGYNDIFDGRRYKELCEEGFFSDYRDIALTASIDGYQIFKQKTDDC